MVIITNPIISKKLLQNKVTVPIEVRDLLNIRDGEKIDFVIETVNSAIGETYKVFVRKSNSSQIIMK